MRIHYLQHVPFEGPAAIEEWALKAGHAYSGTHLYRGEPLPQTNSFDLLVIMGGPMSVKDEQEYPWLIAEKSLVQRAIELNLPVLGICLGAQMIASALGMRIHRAAQKEIGWFPVRRLTSQGIGALFPESFTPLHWHGETFDLPTGAIRLAETDDVPNQAFQLGDKVIGLQFHLEATLRSVEALVQNAAHEIEEAQPFQQPASAILAQTPKASSAVQPILFRLLNHLTRLRV